MKIINIKNIFKRIFKFKVNFILFVFLPFLIFTITYMNLYFKKDISKYQDIIATPKEKLHIDIYKLEETIKSKIKIVNHYEKEYIEEYTGGNYKSANQLKEVREGNKKRKAYDIYCSIINKNPFEVETSIEILLLNSKNEVVESTSRIKTLFANKNTLVKIEDVNKNGNVSEYEINLNIPKEFLYKIQPKFYDFKN